LGQTKRPAGKQLDPRLQLGEQFLARRRALCDRLGHAVHQLQNQVMIDFPGSCRRPQCQHERPIGASAQGIAQGNPECLAALTRGSHGHGEHGIKSPQHAAGHQDRARIELACDLPRLSRRETLRMPVIQFFRHPGRNCRSFSTK
jgi:hypothetical protein